MTTSKTKKANKTKTTTKGEKTMTKSKRPSFVPEMIPNYVIGNNDAKIHMLKAFKEGEETILTFCAIGNNREIVGELIARLYDQGYIPENEGKMERIDITKWCATYLVPAEENEKFRACFRLCKSPGRYNNPGLIYLATLEAERKAEIATERAEERRLERLRRNAERALKKLKEAEKAVEAAKKAVDDAA